MKKIFLWLLLGCLLFLLTGAIIARKGLACELVPILGYPQLSGQIFIAKNMDLAESGHLLELIAQASNRLKDIYGQPDSQPRILITNVVQTAKNWGANEVGSMHRLPWRSCIVIGPKGHNVDVIAHEMLHAEIQHRVGFWRFLKEIPVWFDEGAALTLDYRDTYLPENIVLSTDQVIKVRSLIGAGGFFAGNIKEHYQAARLAVIPLINAKTFFKDLEKVAAGERFENVFLKANTQMPSSTDLVID